MTHEDSSHRRSATAQELAECLSVKRRAQQYIVDSLRAERDARIAWEEWKLTVQDGAPYDNHKDTLFCAACYRTSNQHARAVAAYGLTVENYERLVLQGVPEDAAYGMD